MIVNKINKLSTKNYKDNKTFLTREDCVFILNNESLEDIKSFIKGKITKKAHKEKRLIKYSNKSIKERAESFRTRLVKNQTDSEKKFKAILKMLGIHYDFQKILYTERSFYIVDFYLPDYGIVIEVDGGYHEEEDQKIKDKMRDAVVMAQVKRVYRFKNEEIENTDKVVKKINGYLEKFKK